MEIFLVGGAVRDALLNLPVTERDWVVVGSSPEEMLALGFQPVGKDFPVFLHPITHEEYALARTERKIGKGYKGFTFHSDPEVTLIEDLRRRDLTINAIAQSSSGEIIDPYGGQEDLKNKILRHVSPAFQEDPVRILRLARFAARFPEFTVHPDTLILMQNMVHMGEVNALVPERVWQEFSRALETSAPKKFLDVLKDSHAYEILFPEIKLTNDVCKSLQNAVEISTSPLIRFSVLLQHLDKKAILDFGNRYRIPREFIDLCLSLITLLESDKSPDKITAEQILKLLKSTDSRRRPERFRQTLLAYQACTDPKNPKIELLQKTSEAVNKIDTQSLQQQSLTGPEFMQQLEKMQLEAIQPELNRYFQKA